MEKALKLQISEIWEAVIPISCPHCQAKNPGFRKDGFTKLFRKPLSEKLKNQIKQQDRVKKEHRSQAAEGGEDEKFEVITDEASTRKHSHVSHSEKSGEFDDIYEDEEEDEELPSNQ